MLKWLQPERFPVRTAAPGVIKRGLCLAEREESAKPAVQRCDCCGPKPSELSSRDTHFKDFGLRQRQRQKCCALALKCNQTPMGLAEVQNLPCSFRTVCGLGCLSRAPGTSSSAVSHWQQKHGIGISTPVLK